MHTSETQAARISLSKWCRGYGVDLGAGGDKIVPHAIAIDKPVPYACTGLDPVQLGGDARNLYWFKDGVLDFVYSSHLLEDFEDTVQALYEWTRILKIGGHLVLYLPDEQVYRIHCAKTAQPRNSTHKHSFFCARYVKECVGKLPYCMELVHETAIVNNYSFELVYRKSF